MLPDPAQCPDVLRMGITEHVQATLAGRWRLFGYWPIQVDEPPRWQKDYSAGLDLTTQRSAFGLNHRQLPGGADIKLVWELGRWSPLVRLAQGAFLLGDIPARDTCFRWLWDWVEQNLPYRGYQWTSALEGGIRLIQFAWIDALILACAQRNSNDAGANRMDESLDRLRRRLLPPLVWFVWRYRSYGSSANNHLLGELAGLMVALARWPELEWIAAPLGQVQAEWEREVLKQFATDGGHREQALNYHLFSFEFCWQAYLAVQAAGRPVQPAVRERLHRAADYYATIQVVCEPWDYGDSDSAWVTPFVIDDAACIKEWADWFECAEASPALQYWLGNRPPCAEPPAGLRGPQDWLIYPETGMAVSWNDDWILRWDLTPLGYLSTAAHGHLDALHVSIWHGGLAFIIDPGTGAYYQDPKLRAYLSSWEAHNGPRILGLDFPRRLGPFLWDKAHERPVITHQDNTSITAELNLTVGKVQRTLRRLSQADGWQVDDACELRRDAQGEDFGVTWQFAPECRLVQEHERTYRVIRDQVNLEVSFDGAWKEIHVIQPEPHGSSPGALWGLCSPRFRQVQTGPQIRLVGRANGSCVLRTTFLASSHA
jgi:hypothetical protein